MKCREMPQHFNLERLMGVEPTYAAWEAAVLPMNYSRGNKWYYSRPFSILQHEKWRLHEIPPLHIQFSNEKGEITMKKALPAR